MERQLLIVGAGGHAKVVIDVARSAGWNPVALLDQQLIGQVISDVPVVGGDEKAAELFHSGVRAAAVAIGNNKLRHQLGRNLQSLGFHCPVILHSTAVVSPYASLGAGTVVMANAVVNSHAKVGIFSIVNSGAIVEHDCLIGDAVHVAPRSVMGGNTIIGDETLFGIGSTARPLAQVGSGATIGAGSVVASVIPDSAIVVGVPAKLIRRVEEKK